MCFAAAQYGSGALLRAVETQSVGPIHQFALIQVK
jgi:hypothetical protein